MNLEEMTTLTPRKATENKGKGESWKKEEEAEEEEQEEEEEWGGGEKA